MTDFKFQDIQTKHLSSKNLAFEEFCCQLFEFFGIESGWDNEAKFKRKGSGADGGVEAYWLFNNGDEYGIQAKFPDKQELNGSVWSQIDKSVKVALKTHPNLKRYYICTPFNKPDPRQKNKKSQMGKWENYEEKWKKIKDIYFIWWGDFQLRGQLIKDNPFNSGIKNYWFNKDSLTKEWFKNHLEQTKNNAGPRYSSQLNVDTKTGDYILRIARHEKIILKNKKLLEDLRNDYKGGYKTIKDILCLDKIPKEWNLIQNIEDRIKEIGSYLYDDLYIEQKNELSRNIRKNLNHILYNKKYEHIIKPQDNSKYPRDLAYEIRNFLNNLGELDNFIEQTNNNTYLILGKAGMGKTHLLCDVLAKSLEDEYICLLILGNYLKDNNLESAIINNLEDFDNINELLGALNSYAKSKEQIALFIIDGINEWEECKRSQILPNLKNLKDKIDKYGNIKLLISCRSEYEKDIFKKGNFVGNHQVVWHDGFLDNSIDTLHKFCEYYKITIPSTPILTPELSNPLILKTICKAFQDQGKFPNGMQGLSLIFNSYIEYLNRKISSQLDLDADDEKIQKVVKSISDLIYNNDCKIIISKDEIKLAVKNIDISNKWSESILYHLEKEGFLVLTKDYCYLSYDKYRDYLISNCILNDTKILQLSHLKTALAKKIDSIQEKTFYNGIIDCLSVLIPEKFDFDLINLYKDKNPPDYFIEKIISAFYNSIAQRSQSSISENTIKDLEYLKTIANGKFKDYYWKTLISCSPIENHPLNAEYLHNILIGLTIPDLDADWTQFISINYENDFNPKYDDSSNYFDLKTLIAPFINVDNNKLSDKTIELISMLLIWITSSTNRFLRKDAIIATVNLLRNKEDINCSLLEKFDSVKDVYIKEGLYSITYGVVLFSCNKDKVKKISEIVFQNVFNKDVVFPNVLVRDSAYGIMQTAKHIGIDISGYNNKIEPPYNYPKIRKYPSNKYIEKNYSKLEPEGKEDSIARKCIYGSVKSNDFNWYTMKSIQDWYDNPLSKKFIVKEKEENYYDGTHELFVLKGIIKFDDSTRKKIKTKKKYVEYGKFNYEKATNWICNKAYKLGGYNLYLLYFLVSLLLLLLHLFLKIYL